MIHLHDERWENFVYHLETIFPPPRKSGRGPAAALRHRQFIARAMNHYFKTDPARVEPLGAALEQHCQRLAVAGLNMDSPIVRFAGLRLFVRMIAETAMLVLSAVPVLLATLHHLVPLLVFRTVAPLFQAPGKSTVSLARIAIGLPIFALGYTAVWFAMSSYFQPWVAWIWAGMMPLAGLYTIPYWRRARAAGRLWFHQLRLLTRRRALQKFRRQHEALCQQLRELATEYATISEPSPDSLLAHRSNRRPAFGAIAVAVIVAVLIVSGTFFRPAPAPSILDRQPLDLASLSLDALERTLARNEATLTDAITGIAELEARAFAFREEFLNDRRSYYRQEDNDAIRQMLLSYLNYRTALLRIIWRCEDYRSVSDEALRARTFLVGFTAASVLYKTSLQLVVEFGQTPEAVRKLNEPEPLWQIPAGLYDTIKANLANPEVVRWMGEARTDYHIFTTAFEEHGLADATPYPLFHNLIREAEAVTADLVALIPAADLPPLITTLAAEAADVYYRGKSVVSLWIGDARIRSPRAGESLIQSESLTKLSDLLQPGDILLERRNWFLSNAFLPGYWPHSALYVGTVEDLVRLGLDKDPRVRHQWKNFTARDAKGHEHVIIEAIGEGVVFTSLEYSVGEADSAAVLRPNLDENEIRESIARAFSHVGKPYDFDFDFFSTDKLVCTKLVFRAYDGNLDFPLIDILGRKTMPAVELVRKFSEERGGPGAQLQFVAFLDGDESTGRATFKDGAAFQKTLHRPALTWLQ